MFAFKPRIEAAVRALLIAVILFNAVVPMAALAKAEQKPDAGLASEAGRSLPEQKPLYFNSPDFTYPQQTSPDPDKPKSSVPSKIK